MYNKAISLCLFSGLLRVLTNHLLTKATLLLQIFDLQAERSSVSEAVQASAYKSEAFVRKPRRSACTASLCTGFASEAVQGYGFVRKSSSCKASPCKTVGFARKHSEPEQKRS